MNRITLLAFLIGCVQGCVFLGGHGTLIVSGTSSQLNEADDCKMSVQDDSHLISVSREGSFETMFVTPPFPFEYVLTIKCAGYERYTRELEYPPGNMNLGEIEFEQAKI